MHDLVATWSQVTVLRSAHLKGILRLLCTERQVATLDGIAVQPLQAQGALVCIDEQRMCKGPECYTGNAGKGSHLSRPHCMGATSRTWLLIRLSGCT